MSDGSPEEDVAFLDDLADELEGKATEREEKNCTTDDLWTAAGLYRVAEQLAALRGTLNGLTTGSGLLARLLRRD